VDDGGAGRGLEAAAAASGRLAPHCGPRGQGRPDRARNVTTRTASQVGLSPSQRKNNVARAGRIID
jgi:hypothetical protein